ncbi:MAG: asparagine synthase (glutamine-hydrolyzing) [Verrucomicrobiales bacterium]|nr:asparagine synthase (glutamine-hydrolyzing) [Verrucomicrobiales bacterium]
MCGIAGIVNCIDGPPPGGPEVARLLGPLRHRGPDQFGIYTDDHVGLGNARLSIVDLAHGQQPIGNEDGTLWIVYNGEVFNHLELRAELEARGHRFVTRTDTEVIVHLFEEYGPACLGRLNGQFAFALWDARRRSLFLARDRLGVRPLFHTRIGGRFLFASEIKALFADPAVPRSLDVAGVANVFAFWAALPPSTCFEGIHELPPGHCLEIREGTAELRRYWQWDFATDERLGEEEATEALTAHLDRATRLRLRSDVPVGAYLSGGLDSSVIASLIRDSRVAALDTFSIAFRDPAFDESEHQRAMAEFLGTRHHVVEATHEDIGRVFPEVVWHAETPLVRTAPAPMFLLSKRVRDAGYKVVLTGEGADELLGGYDVFKEAKIRRFWSGQPASTRRPRLLGRLYPDIARLSATSPAYLAAFFGARLTETDAADFSHAIRWKNSRRTLRFFRPEHPTPNAGLPDRLTIPEKFLAWDPLQRAQYLESTLFLSGYLLAAQGDRVAMAHSVEGRYPFLDPEVVGFCSRLPARYKLRGLREKWLLRRLARTRVPDSILRRRKRPYRAPIHRSFATTAGTEYVAESLSEKAIAEAGVFRPEAVARLEARRREGAVLGETDDMALVGVLSTQLLHRQYVRAFSAPPPLDGTDDVKWVHRGAGTPSGPWRSVPR